jgi:predicted DNA-binding helix-hairpin-helix protein
MRHAGLTRTYFSAFRPVPDTPLAGRPPESPRRELRLYQASYLLRDYGFTVDDLSFGPHQRLPLGEDPKLAWAWQHLAEAPVEVNSAPPQELLRVPGIGPRLAQRLVEERVRGCLRDLSDLGRLGVAVPKAAPFILLAGKRPPRQLRLF